MNEQIQLGPTKFDRWAELDARVEAALCSPMLEEWEKEVLRVIASRKGAASAIKSSELAWLAGVHHMSAERNRRQIAAAVETFVQLFGIPIGGLRIPPYGYFLIVDRADLDLAIGPLWGEVYAHLRRLRALTSKQTVAKLFGQAMLKLDKTEAA